MREMLDLVTRRSDKSKSLPELYGMDSDSKDSLPAKFLLGLQNSGAETDDELAEYVYGTKADQRYRTLKSRTYERLIQALLLLQIKPPHNSEYLSCYYKTMRNMMAAETLTRFSSLRSGESLAVKTLATAEKYHFIEICCQLVTALRIFARNEVNIKKFNHYDKLSVYYLEVLSAQNEAVALMDRLNMITYQNTKMKNQIAVAEKSITRINELTKKFNTYTLVMTSCRAEIGYLELVGDFAGILSICNYALEYLNKNPHLYSKARDGEYTIYKVACMMYLRQMEEAFLICPSCISKFQSGGQNWFVAHENYFNISMILKKFSEAEDCYIECADHPRFNGLSTFLKERFSVAESYLLIAERLNLFSPKVSRTKTFRLSKFLNSVEIVSKDKSVQNAIILFAHVVFLILDKKYAEAEKRIEYLRVYGTRYLKDAQFEKPRLFIRVLQFFPRYGFDARLIRPHLKNVMAEMDAEIKNPVPGELLEVIPFEVLTEALLQHQERSAASEEA